MPTAEDLLLVITASMQGSLSEHLACDFTHKLIKLDDEFQPWILAFTPSKPIRPMVHVRVDREGTTILHQEVLFNRYCSFPNIGDVQVMDRRIDFFYPLPSVPHGTLNVHLYLQPDPADDPSFDQKSLWAHLNET